MRHQVNHASPALLPRLRRFAIALTRNAADADDLVQMACDRVLTRRDRLRSDSEVAVWIYGIMRNTWTNEIRARRSRSPDGAAATEFKIDAAADEIVEDTTRLAAVRGALAELPEDQRTVLVLVCVDGLSYTETAKILGIPMGTVTRLVAQAREALHERMIGQSRRGGFTEGSPNASVAAVAPSGPAPAVVPLHPVAADGE